MNREGPGEGSAEMLIQEQGLAILSDPDCSVQDAMRAIAKLGGVGVLNGDTTVAEAAASMLRAGAQLTEASGGAGSVDDQLGKFMNRLSGQPPDSDEG